MFEKKRRCDNNREKLNFIFLGGGELSLFNNFVFCFLFFFLFIVLWTDFVAECFNVIVYLLFFIVVLVYIGRPLHLIRQMYYTFRRFIKFVHDIANWRRATANMEERYPNVTLAELQEQNADDIWYKNILAFSI